VDQGDPAGDAIALAPSRSWLTPTRALLLALGAVLGGVALSLFIGSSPAHAAEGDGSGPGAPSDPLVTATSSLTGALGNTVTAAVSTVSAGLGTSIPLIQHSVDAAGHSVATRLPITAPLVAPVVASVDTTLAAVQQLVAPTLHQLPSAPALLPVGHGAAGVPHWTTPSGSQTAADSPPAGSALGALAPVQNGAGSDGTLPGPVLTGASGSPAVALALVFGAIALVLLGARRRWHDDPLPASPAYELDTSPA